MPNKEDLAATPSAAHLAAEIGRKSISPVEVMDAAIARIEAHNAKINAIVIFGFEEARKAAKAAEAAVMRGDAVGPLHGVPIAMKDCFDFKPGWISTFGGIRALKNYVAKTYCMFAERMEQCRGHHPGQDQQSGLWFPRHHRQLSVRPFPKPLRFDEEHRADPPAAVPLRLRLASSPCAKAPTGEGRSVFLPLGAGSSATSRPLAACRW